MSRKDGTYIFLIDFLFFGECNTMCLPLHCSNGEAKVLSYDGCNCWRAYGPSIKGFANIDEGKLFDEIKSIIPHFSTCDDGINHRLKHLNLDNGQSYKTIYRPVFSKGFINDSYVSFQDGDIPSKELYQDLPISNQLEYSNLLRQLEIVLDDLESVFKVVAPNRYNKKVYGHSIRNIILLACTEIDMMMKHILERNVYTRKKTYSTNDYIHLLKPLRLNEYKVGFRRFGNSSYSPFWRWNNEDPSKSIWWYDAYNKVKHDREENFKHANLGTAINAVMAFAITLIAQYGYRNGLWNERVGKIINVMKEPQWKLEDFYVPSPEIKENIPYPFKMQHSK